MAVDWPTHRRKERQRKDAQRWARRQARLKRQAPAKRRQRVDHKGDTPDMPGTEDVGLRFRTRNG